MISFSQAVIENIGHYVYVLVDPRDSKFSMSERVREIVCSITLRKLCLAIEHRLNLILSEKFAVWDWT